MASTLDVSWKAYGAGDWGEITREVLSAGWADSELATRALPLDEWLDLQDSVIADSPHAQVIIKSSGVVVGLVMLLDTVDAQVGEALIAFHQFLRPEHRGSHAVWRKVMRAAEQVAREANHEWLVWTHRAPSGRIYQTYKEIS